MCNESEILEMQPVHMVGTRTGKVMSVSPRSNYLWLEVQDLVIVCCARCTCCKRWKTGLDHFGLRRLWPRNSVGIWNIPIEVYIVT